MPASLAAELDAYRHAAKALVVLLAGALSAIGVGAAQCAELDRCRTAGTCFGLANDTVKRLGGQCGFVNLVSLGADRLYSLDGTVSYAAATRGTCAPGERTNVNFVTGEHGCHAHFSFPNALSTEIQDLDATTPHERYCGAWLDAGDVTATQTSYWSFREANRVRTAVLHAQKAMFSSTRLSASDLGKIYSKCTATVLAGSSAIRASGLAAYNRLASGLTAAPASTTAWQELGWLVCHYCGGPASVGVALASGKHRIYVREGTLPEANELASALFALEEGAALQEAAEAGAAVVRGGGSAELDDAEVQALLAGARGVSETLTYMYSSNDLLKGFKLLVDAGNGTRVGGLLHGLAATCSLSIQSHLSSDASTLFVSADDDASSPMYEVVGLNRLALHDDDDPHEVDLETELAAATATWTQITAQPNGDAAEDCATLARAALPDRADALSFELVFTDAGYAKLETLVETMRAAVIDALRYESDLRDVLAEPDAVATAVAQVRIRIAGAPRGSWGGATAEYADGDLTSDDGPLESVLKASRALFLDRVERLAVAQAGHCEGGPVYDALRANAYIFPAKSCSFVLLGVLSRPFFDERYDEVSLSTRIGYVVAHELAHATYLSAWSYAGAGDLLSEYATNRWGEALADVVAAVAIVRAGLATAAEVCGHVSQVWCARVPIGSTYSSSNAHPAPNERGDKLCATLEALGYAV